jgi:tetratricopeptide (TPR) repeat protein
MAVLQVLARAKGAVVSRNEILETVWPRAAVTDDVLTHCIVELRKAFDDSAQDPKVIQTIPKKGFRLIAEVSPVGDKPAKSQSARRYAAAVTALVLAGAIAIWYAGQETARPPAFDGTANVEAYEAFLAGDDELFGDQPEVLSALKHYERATELDPEFALAWARMAEAYRAASWVWGEDEPYLYLERSDRAIATALRLAPDSPDVVATHALQLIHRTQWRDARRILDELRLQEGGKNVLAAIVSIDLSLKMGALDDAYRDIRLVIERDPENRRLPVYLSHYYLLSDLPEEALAVLESRVEDDTDDAGRIYLAADAALATGRREEIEKWLRRYIDEMPDEWLNWDPPHRALLDRLDDRDAMLEYLRELQSRDSNMDHLIPIWAAYFGDEAMALESLRRSPNVWYLWHPVLKGVRATDEFRQIVIGAGLVDYWREFGWGSYCSPTKGDDFECH